MVSNYAKSMMSPLTASIGAIKAQYTVSSYCEKLKMNIVVLIGDCMQLF